MKKNLLVLLVACLTCLVLFCSCENMPSFGTDTSGSISDGIKDKVVSSYLGIDQWLLKAYLMKQGELLEGPYLVGIQYKTFDSACNALANKAIERYSRPAELDDDLYAALCNTARITDISGGIATRYFNLYFNRNVRWESDFKDGEGLIQEITSSLKTVTDRIIAGNATCGDVVLMGELAEIVDRIGDASLIFKDGTKRTGAELFTDPDVDLETYVNGTFPFELKDIDMTATISANRDLVNRGSRFLNLLSAFAGTGKPTADRFATKLMGKLLSNTL